MFEREVSVTHVFSFSSTSFLEQVLTFLEGLYCVCAGEEREPVPPRSGSWFPFTCRTVPYCNVDIASLMLPHVFIGYACRISYSIVLGSECSSNLLASTAKEASVHMRKLSLAARTGLNHHERTTKDAAHVSCRDLRLPMMPRLQCSRCLRRLLA